MDASTKRLLTAKNSKLVKVDLLKILNQDAAWSCLPAEMRQELCNLLPHPKHGDPPHDIDVNPFRTDLAEHLEEAVQRWQLNLGEGRETKKFKEDAIAAAHEYVEQGVDDKPSCSGNVKIIKQSTATVTCSSTVVANGRT